ncbi:MAG: CHAP domain-containing protein [Chitinivibrionales bacterium]|nr:CHAP domain-containing protein [Chitinivibrionales bacterium]
MKTRAAVLVFVFAALVLAQSTSLTGTIVNQAGFPVKGLVVNLATAGVVDTTNDSGAFALEGATAVARPDGGRQAGFAVDVHGWDLTVNGVERPTPMQVALFDLRGARLAPPSTHQLAPGRNRQSLLPPGLPTAGAAIVVAEVRVGTDVMRFRIASAGSRVAAQRMDRPRRVTALAAAPLALDQLVIAQRGETRATIDIDQFGVALDIQLDLIPWEVLEIAVLENGRYPDEVGHDLTAYPYDLTRYLDKTGDGDHDYEAWCSEFVSWAYRAGGYPLSGGWQVSWMLGGSTTLRTWFRTYADFVDRSHADWDSFVPSPGDYVRYETSGGGHSGLVIRCSGDTLYTVEGNVSNRVRLRAIRNWQDYQSGTTYIDGIGRRSGCFQSPQVAVRQNNT